MFGGIVYGLVGLVPTVAGFWKFMLTLVLFNLTTASVVLWLSIAFDSVSVASLVGTLVMLFKYVFLSWTLRCLANEQRSLLFTGLLINRETVAPALQWLHTISFFHAAFEALAVNELRYLQLKEIKAWVLSCPLSLYSPLDCSTELNWTSQQLPSSRSLVFEPRFVRFCPLFQRY